jgi:diguanylate cyclase
MTNKDTVAKQLSKQEKKLELAVNSILQLENALKAQSVTFANLIDVLSKNCTGIGRELNNRLNKLKKSLSFSAPLIDIEAQVTILLPLLKKLTEKNNQQLNSKSNEQTYAVDPFIVDKFSSFLNDLVLSEKYQEEILQIKNKIAKGISNDVLLDSFFATFKVIIEDIKQNKDTAESFLSSLSNTLTTVKSAVKESLSSCNKSTKVNLDLNQQLNIQIKSLEGSIEKVDSFTELKLDINEKIQQIANTLEKKSFFEEQHHQALQLQLKSMNLQVKQLESKSAAFEKRLKEQQEKSTLDALTKLSNRAAFDEYFSDAITRFHKKPFDLAIVVADLDDFKRVNDTFGHTAGDKTLQVISTTLKKHFKKNVFIGRYGGEEFVLIFSNIKQGELLSQLNVFREKTSRLPFKFKDKKLSITMSLGVTHIKTDDNINTAFERADTALYQAKEQGKNRVNYL